MTAALSRPVPPRVASPAVSALAALDELIRVRKVMLRIVVAELEGRRRLVDTLATRLVGAIDALDLVVGDAAVVSGALARLEDRREAIAAKVRP